MGKRRRVDNDETAAVCPGILNLSDQFMFGITLEAGQLMAVRLGQFDQAAIDVSQGAMAVVVRLALTEKVQVGAVKYQY